MYKKIFISSLFLLLTMCIWPAQAAVLKIATIAPEGSNWMRMMREGTNEVERRTQGRVKFKFYPGGVMGTDKSVLRKIRIRQLHGGAITTGSISHIYPDMKIYGLPLLFRSSKEADYVRARIDKQLIQGLEKKGFVNFGFAEGGFAYLMANKPVRGIKDLAKQKVWVPSGDSMSLIVFRNAKVSPIPLQMADVMTGLQTGLIDTITSPATAAIALQWYTRVKYFTDVPLSYTTGVLVIERKAFNKINPKDQKVVREVMSKTFARMNKQFRADNIKARDVLKAQGIKFIKPSPQEIESWRVIALDSRQEMVKKGYISQVTLNKITALLKRYRGSKK